MVYTTNIVSLFEFLLPVLLGKYRVRNKIRSILWCNPNNKDFIEVCFLAGLDPWYVYKKATEIKIKNP